MLDFSSSKTSESDREDTSKLDLLTPAGKFSVSYARKAGFDGPLKPVTIRRSRTGGEKASEPSAH